MFLSLQAAPQSHCSQIFYPMINWLYPNYHREFLPVSLTPCNTEWPKPIKINWNNSVWGGWLSPVWKEVIPFCVLPERQWKWESTMEKEEIYLGGCWIKDQLSYPHPSSAQCSQPTELLHRDILRAFPHHILEPLGGSSTLAKSSAHLMTGLTFPTS